MIAVAFIDLAIFFTIGALWIFGTGFIIVLYKWIAGFEAAEAQRLAAAAPAATEVDVAPSSLGTNAVPEERLAS
jgi:hypothetical protein